LTVLGVIPLGLRRPSSSKILWRPPVGAAQQSRLTVDVRTASAHVTQAARRRRRQPRSSPRSGALDEVLCCPDLGHVNVVDGAGPDAAPERSARSAAGRIDPTGVPGRNELLEHDRRL
jgi:hypothetical protein